MNRGAGPAPETAGFVEEQRFPPALPLLVQTGAVGVTSCALASTYVMAQLGHTDPPFTLRVYTHVTSQAEDERDRPRILVEGGHAGAGGSSAVDFQDVDATDPTSMMK